MNIYQKILEIMKEVQYLAKDDKVSFGQTNYKALSEEKVTTIMRRELIKHGLIVYPCRQEANRTGQITHVDVTYRMVDTETGESVEIASCGDGADSQDKGSGKAMTYAFKYMWLRTFALPTGEDPDKISSAQLDDEQAKKNAEQARQNAAAERLAARAMCQSAMKGYLQRAGADQKACWAEVAETIGKASKDFTAADWNAARALIEGWA